ncbi:MAG: hypothetical protein FWC68_03750 [Oscillospiraceae bacterium]|nr:hypothetical protein [Oscillospiraceae bacterium]
MLYPYVTLGDGTEILHSQIIEKDGVETIAVQFEKPIEEGFKSARCILPTYEWINVENCTDEDIAFYTQIVESNAHLFYEFARVGGATSA